MTPSSNIFEAADSPAITLTQHQPLELGSGEEEQDQEGGIVSGSLEDEVISDSPITGVPSTILEEPHSPTPLERLFRGSRSPVSQFGEEMDQFNYELIGVSELPPSAATNNADATEQLLHGIDDLSNWEPTPSIHSHSRRDRLPPTFDKSVGLWYHSNTFGERYQSEDDGLYKKFGRVQASRVREDELQYGWELIQGFIRTSIWISPANLGKQVNHLVSNFSFLTASLYPANEG